MAVLHLQPGDVADVRPLGAAIADTKTSTLINTDFVKVIRMVLSAGKEIAQHQAPGEIIVQCLEGCVKFTTMGQTIVLEAGRMFYLAAGEPHSVHAIDNSSFLLTILLPPEHSAY